MPKYRTLTDADVNGKRVLIRAGFDVALENGKVMDTERIEAVLPTIEHILKNGGSAVIMSHQGRPKGKRAMEFSQKPVVEVLEKFLKKPVQFAESCRGPETEKLAKALKPGEILFLENLRFEEGEEKNDPILAKDLAHLADLYVNDAFTNCHRKHASMVGVAELLPAYAGLNLAKELEYLSKVHDDPRRPLVLIISGAKLETKVPIIENFLLRGDDILLGGCIANTFIAASGFDVAKSKYEKEYVTKAQELMLEADKEGQANIHVPTDVVVASAPTDDAANLNVPVEAIEGDMAIFDLGKGTMDHFIGIIEKAGMILWNGPLGFYEVSAFAGATKRLAEAVAAATKRGATSIVGGGDTIDFHSRYGFGLNAYTFVSTGGGAMLEYVSGKDLPALTVLEV